MRIRIMHAQGCVVRAQAIAMQGRACSMCVHRATWHVIRVVLRVHRPNLYVGTWLKYQYNLLFSSTWQKNTSYCN